MSASPSTGSGTPARQIPAAQFWQFGQNPDAAFEEMLGHKGRVFVFVVGIPAWRGEPLPEQGHSFRNFAPVMVNGFPKIVLGRSLSYWAACATLLYA
jgi:hypothetical protein